MGSPSVHRGFAKKEWQLHFTSLPHLTDFPLQSAQNTYIISCCLRRGRLSIITSYVDIWTYRRIRDVKMGINDTLGLLRVSSFNVNKQDSPNRWQNKRKHKRKVYMNVDEFSLQP